MGVADSPDLANLFAWWYERQSGILEHVQVPYYGRYIDDCIAIVYADREEDAIELLESRIKFDGCTIEWSASAFSQPFLDMRVYIDSDGTLQHMPYKKARNHQERIPWISAHPIDVKRGTFVGEMSRLATLSSKHEHYVDALKGLVALYCARGYPRELVNSWLRENFAKRWESRLAETQVKQPEEVLVLKTEYNLAWNYFSATQLTEQVIGYWKEWLHKADLGDFDREFPHPNRTKDYLSDLDELATQVTEPSSSSLGRVAGTLDLRDIQFLDRRIITSRKRTKNLFDLTSLWKKVVLSRLDEHAAEDLFTTMEGPEPPNPLVAAHPLVIQPLNAPESDDEDAVVLHRRSPRETTVILPGGDTGPAWRNPF